MPNKGKKLNIEALNDPSSEFSIKEIVKILKCKGKILKYFTNKHDWNDKFLSNEMSEIFITLSKSKEILMLNNINNNYIDRAFKELMATPFLRHTKDDTTYFYKDEPLPEYLNNDYECSNTVNNIASLIYSLNETLDLKLYPDENKVILIFNNCEVDVKSEGFKYKGMYSFHVNDEADSFLITRINKPSKLYFKNVFLAKPDQNELSSLYRKYYNKNSTALENEDNTNNNLEHLDEKLDDPLRPPMGRDFTSAHWKKKPKLKPKSPPQDKQEKYTLRTFPQVYRAIEKAIAESGEGKTEWIVRSIIDRLIADHPHVFEELKSQKNDFPEVRSDAQTGIDFMYE